MCQEDACQRSVAWLGVVEIWPRLGESVSFIGEDGVFRCPRWHIGAAVPRSGRAGGAQVGRPSVAAAPFRDESYRSLSYARQEMGSESRLGAGRSRGSDGCQRFVDGRGGVEGLGGGIGDARVRSLEMAESSWKPLEHYGVAAAVWGRMGVARRSEGRDEKERGGAGDTEGHDYTMWSQLLFFHPSFPPTRHTPSVPYPGLHTRAISAGQRVEERSCLAHPAHPPPPSRRQSSDVRKGTKVPPFSDRDSAVPSELWRISLGMRERAGMKKRCLREVGGSRGLRGVFKLRLAVAISPTSPYKQRNWLYSSDQDGG
ncbi:hypothetical protein EYF80_013765 [Liparis tanakae]|uniref:Uncharacterized protein n=1 Tax=Liparis tanakae TaxID=230148 RepID=A0A4Z2IFA4_9TELE|nr:hypothetical protein EYF80_013765 [Liparis tanakae]